MIDFRSDTVTRPSTDMLNAMLTAPVGDDVFGEDPSVNQLESECASLFGMEAAVFCPTGTMSNQIAIKAHTQPGDEVICERLSHVYQYEGGGIAFHSGASVRLLDGDRGRISAEQVKLAINPNDVHKPVSSLVCLENTSNRGGGSCYHFVDIQTIRSVCLQQKLALHLDGARIFNALIARNETCTQYGNAFDTISICLSKGLGAPAGSVLIGQRDCIQKARRLRKIFGGGMRQAGYMAAAGIYALKNNIARLAYDHRHALWIANVLKEKDFIGDVLPVETNIIIFEVKGRFTASELAFRLKEKGIWTIAISPTQVRMVTHLDITETHVEQTIDTIKTL